MRVSDATRRDPLRMPVARSVLDAAVQPPSTKGRRDVAEQLYREGVRMSQQGVYRRCLLRWLLASSESEQLICWCLLVICSA